MKKNDIILICGILFAALAAFLLFSFLNGHGGDIVVVEADGEVIARFPLDEDREYLIESKNGTNLLIIEDGKAYIKEADCPDKICVKTGFASDTKAIICLPNKVVVYITEGD